MNIKLDCRSLTIGIVLGLLVIAGMGAAFPTAHEVGRYQFFTSETSEGQGSGFLREFVFDTETGQVWENPELANTVSGSVGGPNVNADFWAPKAK